MSTEAGELGLTCWTYLIERSVSTLPRSLCCCGFGGVILNAAIPGGVFSLVFTHGVRHVSVSLASFTLSTSKYLVQKEVSIAYSQRCCAHTADVFRTLKTVKPANKGRRLTAYFTTHSTPWLPCTLPIQRITPTQSTIVYSMRPHQLAISYRRAAQSGELH